MGYAAAADGYDVKLAISFDGGNPALMVNAAPPTVSFHGVRGAVAFCCLTPPNHMLYLDNENTANQVVRITGWEE